jgi:hypothetical protein
MRMIGHVDSDLRLPSCVSVSASLIWRWYSSSYVTGGKHPNKQQKVEQGDCIERMAENERQVYREVRLDSAWSTQIVPDHHARLLRFHRSLPAALSYAKS